MTEKRIRDIIVENDVHLTDVIIKAMKQAVNEALEEAAGKAATKESPRKVSNNHFVYDTVVDKQSILKLKVK